MWRVQYVWHIWDLRLQWLDSSSRIAAGRPYGSVRIRTDDGTGSSSVLSGIRYQLAMSVEEAMEFLDDE